MRQPRTYAETKQIARQLLEDWLNDQPQPSTTITTARRWLRRFTLDALLDTLLVELETEGKITVARDMGLIWRNTSKGGSQSAGDV